jgi:hypothetical protein
VFNRAQESNSVYAGKACAKRMVAYDSECKYNRDMPSIAPNGKYIDRHRPGYNREYKKKHRAGKHGIYLLLADAEFETLSQRAKQDGITNHRAMRLSLLNYAKHGLQNG